MKFRLSRDLATVVIIVALILGVQFLPPDTSLRLVRERGTLRVCVPEEYPPLVTGDVDMPGVDIEILGEVARDIGVELRTVTNFAIGKSLDPRTWRITRAQCEILAGGVVGSPLTKSFLETTQSYLETGWALVLRDRGPSVSLSGAEVGFLPGAAGLDRIELSRYLRQVGAEPSLLASKDQAIDAMRTERIEMTVTEALQARAIAGDHGWQTMFLPSSLVRYPVVFGIWKGDLTLKRAVTSALGRLRDQGALDSITDSYSLAPILEECVVCPSQESEVEPTR